MKKTILITGAAYGIGRASAEVLLKNDFIVYGGDKAEAYDHLCTLKHDQFHPLQMDVRSDEETEAAVDQVMAEQGRIDVVFANAGYCLLGPVELQLTEDLLDQFNVNVIGCGRVIAAVLPHMRQAGNGRIIINSSSAGHVSMPGMAWYPATKHAQQGLADGLRMEVKEFGINVSLIEPGYTNTNIDNASFPYLDKSEKHANAPAYASQMKNFREKWGKGIDGGAHPDTVAKVVLHAATADKPKRRYHPHMDAKFALFMRHFVGYWMIDRIIPGVTIK